MYRMPLLRLLYNTCMMRAAEPLSIERRDVIRPAGSQQPGGCRLASLAHGSRRNDLDAVLDTPLLPAVAQGVPVLRGTTACTVMWVEFVTSGCTYTQGEHGREAAQQQRQGGSGGCQGRHPKQPLPSNRLLLLTSA